MATCGFASRGYFNCSIISGLGFESAVMRQYVGGNVTGTFD